MDDLGNTIIQASIYIYFVAFSAGLGLISAAAIGYKVYIRITRKQEIKANRRVKRGVVKHG